MYSTSYETSPLVCDITGLSVGITTYQKPITSTSHHGAYTVNTRLPQMAYCTVFVTTKRRCVSAPLLHQVSSLIYCPFIFLLSSIQYSTSTYHHSDFSLSLSCPLYNPSFSHQQNITYIFLLTLLYAPLSCLHYN